MVLGPHILTGAAIASNISFPPLGLFLALFSHYVIDIIPHVDYPINEMKTAHWHKSMQDFLLVALDVFVGVLMIYIFSNNILLALLGGLMGILPDGLIFLSFVWPNNKILRKHYQLHHQIKIPFLQDKKIPLALGIISQFLIVIMSVFALTI